MQDLHRTPTGNGESLILKPRLAFVAPRVYLAGPIAGTTYDGATGWRDDAKAALAPEIVAFSPMRGKDALKFEGRLGAWYPERGNDVLTAPRSIMTRDHNDVMTADLVIAYLIGAERVSIGTVEEIAWSFAYRKPLVLVEREGGEHWHPMITEAAGWIVETLDDAIYVARSVLLP